MKIAAVIAEFNPFHNGHKFLADCAVQNDITHKIAVLSGDFVQRGDVAVFSKFDRCSAALENGFDLVVELPVCYAVSTAQRFSEGGVKIAEYLGADYLLFGSENGNIEQLTEIAQNLSSPRLDAEISKNLKSGLTYAAARQNAYFKLFGETNSLRTPNDILAIEYISAILKNGYRIKPITVPRAFVEHDSETPKNGFASASMIRNLIKKDEIEKIAELIPDNLIPQYSELIENGHYADVKNIEKAVILKIRSMTAEELKNIPDVGEGLENRIKKAADSSVTLEELYSKIKTKRYTESRIRRIVLSAFLGIDESLIERPMPYLRVLGFNGKGLEILKCADSPVPIITKPSEIKNDPLFKTEMFATDSFNLSLKNPKPSGEDLTAFLIRK